METMATGAVELLDNPERQQNRVAWVLAVGLVLIVVHNASQPLLEYVFLPQVGMALIVGATLFLLADNWKNLNKESLGPKVIWIPLAVIAGSGVLRIVIEPSLNTLAGALFMASMFGLYVVSRWYGEKALALFMPAVLILASSVIIRGILVSPVKNGGLLFNNYALAVEFLLFGFIVSPRKHQWWLSAVVLTALFFTGSEEGLFCCVILGIMLLIRRDWSKKILLPAGILGLILIVATLSGVTQRLYVIGWDMAVSGKAAITDTSLTEGEKDKLLDRATGGRWLQNWTLKPIRPLGYGVNITDIYVKGGVPHNIVLLITEQIGPIAAGAWIFLIIMGMIKTKWKYAFMVMGLIGIWQPLSWTQTAPYLWVLAGAATASPLKSDLIFRRVDEVGEAVENHITEIQGVKEGGI